MAQIWNMSTVIFGFVSKLRLPALALFVWNCKKVDSSSEMGECRNLKVKIKSLRLIRDCLEKLPDSCSLRETHTLCEWRRADVRS